MIQFRTSEKYKKKWKYYHVSFQPVRTNALHGEKSNKTLKNSFLRYIFFFLNPPLIDKKVGGV